MGVFSWKKLKIETESCEGRWAQVSLGPPLPPPHFLEAWESVRSCRSGEAFDCMSGGCIGLALLRGSCLGTGPEVALVSSECRRADGAGSYPPSSFLCVSTSFQCPCLCPVCVFRCTCLSTCVSLTACLHMCVGMSLFPQVLLTAPPHTHTWRCLGLHLSFSPCRPVAVHVSRCLMFRDRVRPGPTLPHREGVRQCHPWEPMYVCAGVCLHVHRDARKLGKQG